LNHQATKNTKVHRITLVFLVAWWFILLAAGTISLGGRVKPGHDENFFAGGDALRGGCDG
jgi:hypothetical protein